MKLVFLVLLGTSLALASTDWTRFKTSYSKSYDSPTEERLRHAIYRSNVQYINRHNAQLAKGETTFGLAMNEFGDLTAKEFAAMYNGARVPKEVQDVVQEELDSEQMVDRHHHHHHVPHSVDWVKKGYVTPIKNQGQCGSCWAFSSTGGLEGQHFRKYKKLVSLSEQNLVDCVTGNSGCGGGWMNIAFTYIHNNDGIDTEASYPYTAEDGSCKFSKRHVGAHDTGYHELPRGSEADLVSTCAKVGPISVAIDASHTSFQFYSHGIYYEPLCSSVNIDHAVLVVGYNQTTASVDNKYYIVKNSWGVGWGNKGYIWMSRDRGNNCAIATYATYPTEKNA